jgi:hypothetical protein
MKLTDSSLNFFNIKAINYLIAFDHSFILVFLIKLTVNNQKNLHLYLGLLFFNFLLVVRRKRENTH